MPTRRCLLQTLAVRLHIGPRGPVGGRRTDAGFARRDGKMAVFLLRLYREVMG